jgi:methylenetetrahydrofolate dehydrogenase (NADP+)/methenyltetrahydrofolate cyclohydrolase
MTAELIDGKALAAKVRAGVKEEVEKLKAKGLEPSLAVVLVGNNPASAVYVRNKIRACLETGIISIEERMPEETTEAELLAKIDELNANPNVHGILVQLPLPKHIDENRVIERIDPDKDVDGFHVENAGRLAVGLPGYRPCTPYGMMVMLDDLGVPLAGKLAVVIGRSNIVGKPMATMLLEKSCTVVVTHSKTRDLASITRQADIVVAAVGRPKMLKADMVKPGAIVLDVGINRMENGKLCGDVDFDEVKEVAGCITPVPGGVGPMTIAMLLRNTVEGCWRRLENSAEA